MSLEQNKDIFCIRKMHYRWFYSRTPERELFLFESLQFLAVSMNPVLHAVQQKSWKNTITGTLSVWHWCAPWKSMGHHDDKVLRSFISIFCILADSIWQLSPSDDLNVGPLETHHMATHIQETYDFSYTRFSHIYRKVNIIYLLTSIQWFIASIKRNFGLLQLTKF